MSHNHPRGKFTGDLGKPWADMTKKEKIARLKKSIKTQDDYVNLKMPKYVYRFGPPSKEARTHLSRMKSSLKIFEGRK